MQKLYQEIYDYSDENDKYIIVCYKWQIEYYERIFKGKVEYYIISDDFPGDTESETYIEEDNILYFDDIELIDN